MQRQFSPRDAEQQLARLPDRAVFGVSSGTLRRLHGMASGDPLQFTAMELIDAKSLFNPATGFIQRGGFAFTCNPYLGCTFGCTYCYAMYLPQNNRPREDWGRWLAAKTNAIDLALKHGRKVAGQGVYLSSVTDPYQSVERSLLLTRGILEALISHQPRLVVQTRGPLVVRDIDILSQFRSLRVNISIPTDSERIRQAFEPKAPPLERRWQALRELQAARLSVGICVTPTLPIENMDRFAAALADARADVLVLQDFHDSRGGFGANTSHRATELARTLDWNAGRYRAFFEMVQAQTRVFEGEAGFFPPPLNDPTGLFQEASSR